MAEKDKSPLDIQIETLDRLLDQTNDLYKYLDHENFEDVENNYSYIIEDFYPIAAQVHNSLVFAEKDYSVISQMDEDRKRYGKMGGVYQNNMDDMADLIDRLDNEIRNTKHALIEHDHDEYSEYETPEFISADESTIEDGKALWTCEANEFCNVCDAERKVTFTCWADKDEPDLGDAVDGLSGYGEIIKEEDWPKNTNKEIIKYKEKQGLDR